MRTDFVLNALEQALYAREVYFLLKARTQQVNQLQATA